MKKLIMLLCLLMVLATGCNNKNEVPEWTEAPAVIGQTEITASADPTEPPAEYRASFLGCGDNIVYYGNVRDAASLPGEREYNFAPTYENVRDIIAAADISMINQETLMADNYPFDYYPCFNGPQDMGLDLVDTGFDIVSIANNHMLDKSGDGLLSTIEFWESQPVTLIGGYKSQADFENIRIIEQNGIRVALLAYTYGTNGIVLEEESDIVIPYLDEETVKRQVREAKAMADCVIVSVHWGDEYTFTPNESQKNYAQIMTEAGADAIIGHHPHVIQPIEWLTAADGSKTLCVYSLGNFVGEQDHDYNMLGGMIGFDIVKYGETLTIENPVFTPTVYYFDKNFYNNRIYLLDSFTEEMAESHGIVTYYERTLSLTGLKEYLSNTINEEFLKK